MQRAGVLCSLLIPAASSAPLWSAPCAPASSARSSPSAPSRTRACSSLRPWRRRRPLPPPRAAGPRRSAAAGREGRRRGRRRGTGRTSPGAGRRGRECGQVRKINAHKHQCISKAINNNFDRSRFCHVEALSSLRVWREASLDVAAQHLKAGHGRRRRRTERCGRRRR